LFHFKRGSKTKIEQPEANDAEPFIFHTWAGSITTITTNFPCKSFFSMYGHHMMQLFMVRTVLETVQCGVGTVIIQHEFTTCNARTSGVLPVHVI
jgi:hypothetical protein